MATATSDRIEENSGGCMIRFCLDCGFMFGCWIRSQVLSTDLMRTFFFLKHVKHLWQKANLEYIKNRKGSLLTFGLQLRDYFLARFLAFGYFIRGCVLPFLNTCCMCNPLNFFSPIAMICYDTDCRSCS